MGKIYKNSIKLMKAWGDGKRANQLGALIGTNPHTSGTPAYTAWNDGFNGTWA